MFAQEKNYQVGTSTWENSQSFIYTSGPNWARIRVRTLWLEHANTIAIHSVGDFHNGHYASFERVNVIILDVEEAGGLFTTGKNVLIIPTSLYTHTQLHAAIERSVNAEGVIDMDELPDCLKGDPDSGYPGANFIGVNREEGSVTENIDSLITRERVPLADAQAILNLLLQNETGHVVNTATEARAETLGIADDVLDIIPWDSKTYENSAQGKMPKGFLGWLWQVISGFFKAIWDFFVWIFEILVEFGLWLIGLFASAIMAAIEAAIKLIILIFVFIILALILLAFLIVFPFLLLIFSAIADTTEGNLTSGFLNAKLNYETKELNFGIYIEWYYYSILDLNLPYLTIKSEINNEIISQTNIGIITPETESISPQFTADDPDYGPLDLDHFVAGMSDAITLSSIIIAILTFFIALAKGFLGIAMLIASLAIMIAWIFVFISGLPNWIIEYKDNPAWFLGMFAGFGLAALGLFLASFKAAHPPTILGGLALLLSFVGFAYSYLGEVEDIDPEGLLDEWITLGYAVGGLFLALIFAGYAANSASGLTILLTAAKVCTVISLSFYIIFIILFLILPLIGIYIQ